MVPGILLSTVNLDEELTDVDGESDEEQQQLEPRA